METTTRITASKVNESLKDHLQRHEDIYDPMLKNHQVILFGEKNDDGLCRDVQDAVKMRKDIKDLKLMVIGAILLQVIMASLQYIK